jgi:hypothetical protein
VIGDVLGFISASAAVRDANANNFSACVYLYIVRQNSAHNFRQISLILIIKPTAYDIKIARARSHTAILS